MCRISDLKYLQSSCLARFCFFFFVNVIQIFVFSGAKQLLSRPGNKSGPRERRWLLHLQGQLRRFLRIQPVGSGGRPECWPVSRCVITVFPAPAAGNLLHFVSCSPFKTPVRIQPLTEVVFPARQKSSFFKCREHKAYG